MMLRLVAVYLFNLGVEALKADISDVIAAASRSHETGDDLTLEGAWALSYTARPSPAELRDSPHACVWRRRRSI